MTASMNYSVREFRHIANRLLHARGAQRHMVNPVRDVLVFAQAGGFDALSELESTQNRIVRFDGRVSAPDPATLVAGGQAAYYVAPTIVDLLVVRAADGHQYVEIVDVTGGELFCALGDYARVRGLEFLSVTVDRSRVGITFRGIARPMTDVPLDIEGVSMRTALRRGFDAEPDQFWRLFHASDQALTPDSDLSRQHAGSQIYDEHGNVIGESDEECYDYIKSLSGDGMAG